MSNLDRAILLVVQIKDAVLAVAETYAMMPPLIDEEHDAIEASDLDRVEALSARKIFLGSQLDGLFSTLKTSCHKISELAGVSDDNDSSATLTASFTAIEKVITDHMSRGESVEQMKIEYDLLKDNFEKFLVVKQAAAQKVDVNRRVLGKILHNRQENYRFWQEVTADTMAAYNKGGKQKAARTSSILNVKA